MGRHDKIPKKRPHAYLVSDLLSVVGKKYKCPTCKNKFKSALERDVHVAKNHS